MITGCVQQYGEQMFNVGRNAWLQAGLPIETPATTVDRQCGSGQQAVNFGAALVATGVHDVVIGSGIEHLGRIPMFVGRKFVDEVGVPWTPELMAQYPLVDQGTSAELIAACEDKPVAVLSMPTRSGTSCLSPSKPRAIAALFNRSGLYFDFLTMSWIAGTAFCSSIKPRRTAV